MIVRARYKTLGGHVHVRVFATLYGEGALGKAGELVFRTEEWAVIAPALERSGWQIVEEGAPLPSMRGDIIESWPS